MQPDAQVRMPERLLHWFATNHLSARYQIIAGPYATLAQRIVDTLAPGPERTVALRKLLESRDAAFRALQNPGA